MNHRPLYMAVALVLAVSWTARAQDAPQPAPREVQPAESRIEFYGFVRFDVIFDTSRPDAAQVPLFIPSEEPEARNTANFTMHPRLTRFGLNLRGPSLDALGGSRLSGRLELDFQNGGRESRAVPRYRHAYLTLGWGQASLLLGQTVDVISPLFPAVNGDTLMWNAGNLGDRRAQARLTYEPRAGRAQWSFAVAAGLTGAIDQQDLDSDGVRDGEAAARPGAQARAGISYPVRTRRLTAGGWAWVAQTKTAVPVGHRSAFDGRVFGADLDVPIGSRGSVRGEVWSGRGLSDVRGGVGQSVNRTTGTTIRSSGGWLEVGGDVTARYAVFTGYTTDRPNVDDLPVGGRTSNGAWYIVNRLNAGRPFVLGVDYLRWSTEFKGAARGRDHRVNAYVTYTF